MNPILVGALGLILAGALAQSGDTVSERYRLCVAFLAVTSLTSVVAGALSAFASYLDRAHAREVAKWDRIIDESEEHGRLIDGDDNG